MIRLGGYEQVGIEFKCADVMLPLYQQTCITVRVKVVQVWGEKEVLWIKKRSAMANG